MECVELGNFSAMARDHATCPRNHGPLPDFDGHARITGPCGDTMKFWLTARDRAVDRVSFITDGCGASLACGSMATCLAAGKPVQEAAGMRQQDILEALGALPKEVEHCALLAVTVLKAACDDFLNHRKTAEKERTHGGRSTCDACDKADCSAAQREAGESEEQFQDRQKMQSRLCRIRHKVVVLSGKGGVGKSTVAVNLAVALSMSGKRVGLLDVDIHGPSIPTMLGLEGQAIQGSEDGALPVVLGGLKVISMGFLLPSPDEAVIWRGPKKMGVIKQFFRDVAWGDLDYLIVDCPPGTGDEPLSVCQLMGQLDGAVIVTTPQKVAAVDVRKAVTFCRELQIPVLGVVENMSGFACPKCGEVTPIFSTGGGQRLAEDMRVPFLGAIPIDPKVAEACDNGHAFIDRYAASPTAAILRDIIQPIAALDSDKDTN